MGSRNNVLFVLILSLGAYFIPSTANATVVCAWGTVMGQLQQICWFEDSLGMGGEGGGGGLGGSGTGGGINTGGGGSLAGSALNTADNPYAANCRSDVMDRHLHAAVDVARTQAIRLATGKPVFTAGAPIKVTYDDGSTERWQITTPLASDPISPVPVAGTLSCPTI